MIGLTESEWWGAQGHKGKLGHPRCNERQMIQHLTEKVDSEKKNKNRTGNWCNSCFGFIVHPSDNFERQLVEDIVYIG